MRRLFDSDAFPFERLSEQRKIGKRTIGGTVTAWEGRVLGELLRFRVTVRTNMDPSLSHFLTSANARIRDAGIEQAVASGYFLDVQVLEPRRPSPLLLRELERLLPLAPDDRPFRIRLPGERLSRA